LTLRPHALDGAVVFFDRATGDNVLFRGPGLARVRRRAPRVVHFGLSSACDLRCAFCFRDPKLASRWTADSVVAWARAFAEAGALEVAFGQGEPLLFPKFPALVRALHESTALGVSFTTNGTRLTDAVLDELAGAYGQLRLSYYDDNEPLARVRSLARRGERFGVNLLVTPANLGRLEATAGALVDAGCGDLLLLSYNGPDPARHLGPGDDRRLGRALLALHARHGARLALKLSVCFGRRLPEVPQLRPWGDDCGAGGEFVALDSARRLSPCSFHQGAAAVGSAAEALALYRRARGERPAAGVRGCARGAADGAGVVARGGGEGAGEADAARGGGEGAGEADAARGRGAGARAGGEASLVRWRGWASNHSTSYTLVGEFPSETKASEYVAEVGRILERCAAAPERDARGEPLMVWQALGLAEPKSGRSFGRYDRASDFAQWSPDVVAGGRRAIVYHGSTLFRSDFYAYVMLRHRGRIVWHLDGRIRAARLVFGFASPAARPDSRLEHRYGEWARDAGLTLGWLPFYEVESAPVRAALREAGASVVVVHESDETLADAIAAPARRPPKRRTEWLLLTEARGDGVERLGELLARLRADPLGEAARLGVAGNVRVPRDVTARLAGKRQLVVRVGDGPVSGALQQCLLNDYVADYLQLVDAEDVRVRLEGGYDYERGAPELTRWLSARDVEGHARPGTRFDPGAERGSKVDLLPRDPLAFFAQLHARYAERGHLSLDLLPARPLADAVATIRADLLATGSKLPDSTLRDARGRPRGARAHNLEAVRTIRCASRARARAAPGRPGRTIRWRRCPLEGRVRKTSPSCHRDGRRRRHKGWP
jgi:hypothetical protein